MGRRSCSTMISREGMGGGFGGPPLAMIKQATGGLGGGDPGFAACRVRRRGSRWFLRAAELASR